MQGDLYQLTLALQHSTAYMNLRIEALTIAILQRLLTYFTTGKASSGVIYGKDPQVVERIQKITAYVNQNYAQLISLSDVAQQISVTKEYLTRFFKQHMEVTVGEYISLVRAAQHVYEDLLGQRGNLTMNGFPSTRALNHVFQTVYHQTAATIYKTEHTLD